MAHPYRVKSHFQRRMKKNITARLQPFCDAPIQNECPTPYHGITEAKVLVSELAEN